VIVIGDLNAARFQALDCLCSEPLNERPVRLLALCRGVELRHVSR
jgi:hypothetical protein